MKSSELFQNSNQLPIDRRGGLGFARGELRVVIERACERRTLECPDVFHRDAEPLGAFRKSCTTACKRAGLRAKSVHDLRRTAIRNLVRAGVPEKVAMGISGHRIRSIFDRCEIVTEDDLAHAMEQVSDHLAAQPRTPARAAPIARAI